MAPQVNFLHNLRSASHSFSSPPAVSWTPKAQLALVDPRVGLRKTYSELNGDIDALAKIFLSLSSSWTSERVLNLMPPGYGWAITQFALWSLGAVAVPQPPSHPLPELQQACRLAAPRFGIASNLSSDLILSLGLELVVILSDDGISLISSHCASSAGPPVNQPSRLLGAADDAMMLFTSGTTGIPKCVMITHSAIAHQCRILGEAWKWTSRDRMFHNLPLTHIHGIINALVLPLWHFSTVEFSRSPSFSPADWWQRIYSNDHPPITALTAVPTMYSRMIQYHRKSLGETWIKLSRKACGRVRVMFSGSAALSARIRDDWYDLTGHQLIERYGMTETGMILSNQILGENIPGHVGFPLPEVTVRLRDQDGGGLVDPCSDKIGEIEVSSRSVFEGYWSVHEQRSIRDSSFTSDGYFRTGDLAQRSMIDGSFKLLGRCSTDIIKSGGEKISAIEVENVIGNLISGIKDVTIVGLPDPEWGEIVGCVLTLEREEGEEGEEGEEEEEEEEDREIEEILSKGVSHLRSVLRSQLASYKLPKVLKIYNSDLPRNLMGKVQKPKLARMAFPDRFQQLLV